MNSILGVNCFTLALTVKMLPINALLLLSCLILFVIFFIKTYTFNQASCQYSVKTNSNLPNYT